MDLGLAGRVAIVCGASAGIGLAAAESLAAEGVRVALFARRTELLEQHGERLGGLAVPGDVTSADDLRRLVDTTVSELGGVDILVNNSGGPPRGPALGLEPEDYARSVELLLLSAVRLTTLCLPHLERSGHGRVITIASSSVKEPVDDLALSNSVRPGVVGWSKTLARELGPRGVTFNAIAPGRIATDRMKEIYPDGPADEDLRSIPLRRLGDPREVGDVVCFLASDRAAYVTGALISVDGGLTRSLF